MNMKREPNSVKDLLGDPDIRAAVSEVRMLVDEVMDSMRDGL